MSPPGRPKGESLRAEREGSPVHPPGRPKGETLHAKREGPPVSATAYRLTPGRLLAVLASGALFGYGLAWSTMVQPEVVLSFLRFQDFGLMLVLGGAVVVTLLAYSLLPRLRKSPLLGGSFERHSAVLNRSTLLGSALFGVGWGLSGVCPGPAIAGLGTGNVQLLWALLGIVAGAGLQGWSAQARQSRQARQAPAKGAAPR